MEGTANTEATCVTLVAIAGKSVDRSVGKVCCLTGNVWEAMQRRRYGRTVLII